MLNWDYISWAPSLNLNWCIVPYWFNRLIPNSDECADIAHLTDLKNSIIVKQVENFIFVF